MIQLMHGDCLELMKEIPDHSVDMVLCDLPYGCLNKKNDGSKWDSQIPFDQLWEQYKRLISRNGAVVLFGSGMFTAELMISNRSWWKYNLIWKKGDRTTGFLNANKAPLRNHEDICVFCAGRTIYNPQMEKVGLHKRNHSRGNPEKQTNNCYGDFAQLPTVISDEKFPKSILNFDKEFPPIHPTQKPVKLLEWLIRTYTNDGDIVLDNCMGSGSTGVACVNTGRSFIGIELEEKYFEIARKRIEEASGTEITGEPKNDDADGQLAFDFSNCDSVNARYNI